MTQAFTEPAGPVDSTLRLGHSSLAATIEQIPLPHALVNVAGQMVWANRAFLEMSGRTLDDIVGGYSISLIHADDLAGTLAALDRLEAGEPLVRQKRRHHRSDGTWLLNDTLMCFVEIDGERHVHVQVLRYSEAAEVCSTTEAEHRLSIRSVGDSDCLHNASGQISYSSRELPALLGRPTGWLHRRRLTDPDLCPIGLDGRPWSEDDDPVVRAITTGTDVKVTMGLRSTNGSIVWFSVRVSAAGTEQYPARSSLREITELVDAQHEAQAMAASVEEQLRFRADHDSLTGLKERHVVLSLLESRLGADLEVAVVFADLDKFKEINDRYGHVVGDEVIVSAANRLVELGPEALCIGRTGGDEFVAVFATEEAAQRYVVAVSSASLTDGALPLVSASVGLAKVHPGDSARDLLRRADDEMYRHKRTRSGADSLAFGHTQSLI